MSLVDVRLIADGCQLRAIKSTIGIREKYRIIALWQVKPVVLAANDKFQECPLPQDHHHDRRRNCRREQRGPTVDQHICAVRVQREERHQAPGCKSAERVEGEFR